MENMLVDNKSKINLYQPRPSLFYDIEGVVVENRGKDIKIEKNIDNKIVEYSLRLKEEIDARVGEEIKVDKENILGVKSEEKEEKLDDEELRDVGDILKELGLEYTKENIRMIEHLIKSGIPITKDSVDSYIKSKECLNRIIENIDPSSFVKLMDRGINLEDENLQDLAEALDMIKTEETPFSIKKFLKLEKDLTYKDAELIGKEIYGQKMGKDVYDTIIALDKENLPITKENINTILEAMAKLYDLKDLENETYVKVLEMEEEFNIDNLFKIKNSYTTTNMEKSLNTEKFEEFTIEKEATIDSLKEMLIALDIEENMDNISILREFIVGNMTMDKENYNKIISMKKDVKELRKLLNHENMAKIINNGIDPIKENIHDLVEGLKGENKVEESIDEEKRKSIIKDLEILGKIQDKDLLKLLKQGEDFNLKSIKEIINTDMEKELTIESKVLNKANHITNILTQLGEELNPETLSLASRTYDTITLENLYFSHKEVAETPPTVEGVSKEKEGLIFEEYLKARNSLTTNMIKESIKDGKVIENMALNEVNAYIEKKINRYKEINKITKEITNIEGNEEKLIPIIMKNNLSMTLREIKGINEILNGEKGISRILKEMTEEENKQYSHGFREEIKLLQQKISKSLKDGDESIKKDYKELTSLMEKGDSSCNDRDHENQQENRGKDYMEIQRKMGKKDMIFQLPIESGEAYKDLNIIIPNIEKGIDKNNMNFIVSLETENLGIVTMDLRIIGKEVQINLEEMGRGLENNIGLLEEGLEKLGYTINMRVEPKL